MQQISVRFAPQMYDGKFDTKKHSKATQSKNKPLSKKWVGLFRRLLFQEWFDFSLKGFCKLFICFILENFFFA